MLLVTNGHLVTTLAFSDKGHSLTNGNLLTDANWYIHCFTQARQSIHDKHAFYASQLKLAKSASTDEPMKNAFKKCTN